MSKARGQSQWRAARRGSNMYKVRPANVGKGRKFSHLQVVYLRNKNGVIQKDSWGKPIILKVIPHFNNQHYGNLGS